MTSGKVPIGSEADKRAGAANDGKQVYAVLDDVERRIVGLAAVLEDVSRPTFIAQATLEKAVTVLTEKNPSALDGTPWALPKSTAA